MARYRLLRTSFTGTTQYFLAMFRGTYWASSTGMEMAVRSTKSTPSCTRRASMSCASVMKPFWISIAQPLLCLLLECQSRLQLLPCDGPGRHQQIAQAHIGHFTHLPVESLSCTDRDKRKRTAHPTHSTMSDPVRLRTIIYPNSTAKSTDFS